MPITKQRTLDYVNQEWGTYVDRFQRLPKAEGEIRVQRDGFEKFGSII